MSLHLPRQVPVYSVTSAVRVSSCVLCECRVCKMECNVPILLQKDNTFTKLFVGGLPYHTTNETLKAFFVQYGDIEEAVVINNRTTGKSMGYGFVSLNQFACIFMV